MKKYKLDKVTYLIPENWGEVTVRRFSEMQAQQHTSKVNNEPDILSSLKVVASLIGCDYKLLLKLSKVEYGVILSYLSFISKPPVKVNKKEFVIGNRGFKIGRDVYRSIDDLTQLTMGQAIDIEMIISDSSEGTFLMNVLPILIKKEGEEFSKKLYTDRKELFADNLMITEVLYTVDFF